MTTIQKIEPAVQKLIDEFVEQIEKKEGELTASKRDIDTITSSANDEMEDAIMDLEMKFEANEISEEEFLTGFRKTKENILKMTKEKLNTLSAKYEKIYSNLGL